MAGDSSNFSSNDDDDVEFVSETFATKRPSLSDANSDKRPAAAGKQSKKKSNIRPVPEHTADRGGRSSLVGGQSSYDPQLKNAKSVNARFAQSPRTAANIPSAHANGSASRSPAGPDPKPELLTGTFNNRDGSASARNNTGRRADEKADITAGLGAKRMRDEGENVRSLFRKKARTELVVSKGVLSLGPTSTGPIGVQGRVSPNWPITPPRPLYSNVIDLTKDLPATVFKPINESMVISDDEDAAPAAVTTTPKSKKSLLLPPVYLPTSKCNGSQKVESPPNGGQRLSEQRKVLDNSKNQSLSGPGYREKGSKAAASHDEEAQKTIPEIQAKSRVLSPANPPRSAVQKHMPENEALSRLPSPSISLQQATQASKRADNALHLKGGKSSSANEAPSRIATPTPHQAASIGKKVVHTATLSSTPKSRLDTRTSHGQLKSPASSGLKTSLVVAKPAPAASSFQKPSLRNTQTPDQGIQDVGLVPQTAHVIKLQVPKNLAREADSTSRLPQQKGSISTPSKAITKKAAISTPSEATSEILSVKDVPQMHRPLVVNETPSPLRHSRSKDQSSSKLVESAQNNADTRDLRQSPSKASNSNGKKLFDGTRGHMRSHAVPNIQPLLAELSTDPLPATEPLAILDSPPTSHPLPTTDSLPNPDPLAAAELSSYHVERVLGRYLEEISSDSEYWTRSMLKRARSSKTTNPTTLEPSVKPFSFSSMKAIENTILSSGTSKALSLGNASFTVEKAAKGAKASFSCPMTPYQTCDAMPAFYHYVEIKKNFLALNQTTMVALPYFDDEYLEEALDKGLNPEEEVRGMYKNTDIDQRPRKLRQLLLAERFEGYVESALGDLGIDWTDLIRFLLDEKPDVGRNTEARKALARRDVYCKEDFARENMRTLKIMSTIATAPDPVKLATAALLFENFETMAEFSLWHVARLHLFDTKPPEEDHKDEAGKTLGKQALLDKFTCRICLHLQCPYHGEINEINEDEHVTTSESIDDAIAKDIINPLTINVRGRLGFKPPIEDAEVGNYITPKNRQTPQYWERKAFATEATERGPFYPCHHPGVSCEDAACSCFENKVPCEKTCSCPSSCARKFQGCACSASAEKRKKGQKMVCFKDERCVCYQLSRECDPDLCGPCGVCEVLDPVNRSDATALVGRCNNASIQRAITTHTVIGTSFVSGLGLFTTGSVEKDQFIGEYKGEIISADERERRWAVYGHQGSYLFVLNAEQEIDGTYYGNKTRFINHARPPVANVYARNVLVNSVHRLGMYAERRIEPFQELLFDYGELFNEEVVRGKKKSKKEILGRFHDVTEVEDDTGTLRARKAAPSSNLQTKTTKSQSRARRRQRELSPDDEAVLDKYSDDRMKEQLAGGTAEGDNMIEAVDAERRLMDYNVVPDGVPYAEDEDGYTPHVRDSKSSKKAEDNDDAEHSSEDDQRRRRRHQLSRPRNGKVMRKQG